MTRTFYIALLIVLVSVISVFSQENEISVLKKFQVKVGVVNDETGMPIKSANVRVNGLSFRYSVLKGKYMVTAKSGDELEVSHPGFETVYYTIKDNEDILIKVEDLEDTSYSFNKMSKRKRSPNRYNEFIDSVQKYKTKDLNKSLSFIEKSLKSNPNKKQTASTYKLLGNVYMHWKQYDLAEDSYQSSLKLINNQEVQFLKGKAMYLLKKYEESIEVLLRIKEKSLSNFQKVQRLEYLGKNYIAKKNFKEAEVNFKKALVTAKKYKIQSKETDISSALANVYAKKGENNKASLLYQNSLKLASKENKKRVLKQQEKVADFLSSSNRYDEEIKLRKETLEEVEADDVTSEDLKREKDSISTQKINYKIGNAYVLKEEYSNAIPYLKKSITDANKKKDLVIEKDATRKLSEVYATVGDYTKALKSYEEYVVLVDALYIRKEQEIQQTKRLNKKITENQSRIVSLEKDKELTESKMSLAYKDQQLAEENYKRQQLIIYSLLLSMVLLSGVAYLFYRNTKQQKTANNLLALKSMRSQMNPHFIFNALNSVNSFIAVNDERSANRYLSEFSKLMRSVLENSDEDFIPLSKEIELLELYVKLEHNRFQDKFDYSIFIEEQIQQENYTIPPMLLQPYIENAIWHGLRYKKEKGVLEISMHQKTKDTIEIIIKDDGVGRKKSSELKTKNQLKQKSKGMSTIQQRVSILNDMYQDKIDVKITDVLVSGEGTKVTVVLKKKEI